MLGTSAIAQAQTSNTDNACPPSPLPLEQQMAYIEKTPAKNAGFLWRLEKDGRTSWLYGTMHLNHIDYAKPGQQIMMGMRQSDVLAVEMNVNEPKQAPANFKLQTFALSNTQLERLRKAYAKDCLPANAHQVGHAFSTLQLSVTQAQRQGLLSGYSPDSRLAQIAKRTNKPIIELETFEQHIKALTPASQSEFDELLESNLTLFESGKMQLSVTQVNKAWRENNWPVIVKLEAEARAETPKFAARLLDDRNDLMAQKIDALHQDGKRVFVAVGAMHMAGKTALPKLLQDKGYAVTYVPLRN
jgi:uncharacterized protein